VRPTSPPSTEDFLTTRPTPSPHVLRLRPPHRFIHTRPADNPCTTCPLLRTSSPSARPHAPAWQRPPDAPPCSHRDAPATAADFAPPPLARSRSGHAAARCTRRRRTAHTYRPLHASVHV